MTSTSFFDDVSALFSLPASTGASSANQSGTQADTKLFTDLNGSLLNKTSKTDQDHPSIQIKTAGLAKEGIPVLPTVGSTPSDIANAIAASVPSSQAAILLPSARDGLARARAIIQASNGDRHAVFIGGEPQFATPANVYVFAQSLGELYMELDTRDKVTGKIILVKEQRRSNEVASFSFICAQIGHLLTLNAQRPKEELLGVAFMRLEAVLRGYVHPLRKPSDYHARYPETIILPDAEFTALCDAGAAVLAEITEPMAEQLSAANMYFAHFASIVACKFRQRGHHYTSEMLEGYNTLARHVIGDGVKLPIPWSVFATEVMHACYPSVMDEKWVSAVADGTLTGSIAVRVDCAAAGQAAYVNALVMIDDLINASPRFAEGHEDQILALRVVVDQIANNRWDGAENRALYGGAPISFDLSKIAALIAAGLAILRDLAPNHKMGESRALLRVAQSAPISGAVLGRMGRSLATSDVAITTWLKGSSVGNVKVAALSSSQRVASKVAPAAEAG